MITKHFYRNYLISREKIVSIFLMIVMILFPFFQEVIAQNNRDGVLEITGWLLNDNDEVIKRGDVRVYDELGNLIVQKKSNKKGRFGFDLPIDRNYTAEFISPGYVTKKISFNTKLPNDFKGFNAFYFEFLVELFPFSPDVNYALLETPYIEIVYIKDKKEFFFEEAISRPMLAEIEQLKEQTYEMIQKRIDYNTILSEADVALGIKDYENAINLYREALDLFVKEQYPREQLESILAIHTPKDDEIIAFLNTFDNTKDEVIAINEEKSDENTYKNDNPIIEPITDNNKSTSESFANNTDVITDSYNDYNIDDDYDENEVENETSDYQIAEISPNLDREQLRNNETKPNELTSNKDKLPEYSFTSDRLIAYFDFANYVLDEGSIKTIEQAITYLKNNPESNLIIYGHTDLRGQPLFNFYLSQLRAHTAYEYCLKNGITSDRVIPMAYGQSRPFIKSAQKESEHKLNRRIEMEFVNNSDFAKLLANTSRQTYRYLNNLKAEKNFSEGIEFMVQFIASKNPVGYSYFHSIITDFKETDIIYYYDIDNLHRYLIGSYSSIEDVRNAAFKLRNLGYDTYIVAFADGKRISVAEARIMLGQAN